MPKARLESELHAALRRQPASLAEVRDVVHASDGQARLTLVNAKSAEGVTPAGEQQHRPPRSPHTSMASADQAHSRKPGIAQPVLTKN